MPELSSRVGPGPELSYPTREKVSGSFPRVEEGNNESDPIYVFKMPAAALDQGWPWVPVSRCGWALGGLGGTCPRRDTPQ